MLDLSGMASSASAREAADDAVGEPSSYSYIAKDSAVWLATFAVVWVAPCAAGERASEGGVK
jgi:hypothetical protein